MAIEIETPDPGVKGVRKALKVYSKMYPDYEDALKLYASIMEIQQKALPGIECDFDMSDEEIERRLTEGEPLVDPLEAEVDPEAFKGLVEDICRELEKRPGGFKRTEEILSWEGLGPDAFADTVDRVLKGTELSIGEEWENEADRKLVSNILWEAFTPFMRKYGSICGSRIDYSLWRKGYCPVCGGPPLIGKFRTEDGLWLLECSLCHTFWNVIRARCPFCEEGPTGQLNYLYVDEDRHKRVQYCEHCKTYVKTIDMRDIERVCVLPLDDIATVRLDLAAAQEGLRQASGLFGEAESDSGPLDELP